MKTIGIFTHDLYPFKPWGQGRYVYDLARHLRRRAAARVIVFSPSPGIASPEHVRIFPNSHATIGKNIYFSLKLARIMDRLIDRYRLDLVHLQGGPGGLFLLRRPSVPALFTVHHTFYQQQKYIPTQRWKWLLYLLEKYSYSKTDHLMADSPSTRDILLRKYGVAPRACSFVPVGVDNTHFHPLREPRIPDSLFFIGRLEKRKGIDFLIRAVARVKRFRPQIKLYIAGSGRISRAMQAYIKTRHLEPNLEFLGTLPDADVNTWYNRVTAVVVPSVFEGFGLAVIEAMACGTPVIATRVDALKDIVRHRQNGLLAEYGDVQGLASQITTLMANAKLRTYLVRNGHATVAARYQWNKISRDVLKIYRSATASSETRI